MSAREIYDDGDLVVTAHDDGELMLDRELMFSIDVDYDIYWTSLTRSQAAVFSDALLTWLIESS